jgi:carbonic anhydrase
MSLVDRKLALKKGLHEFPGSAFGSVAGLLHPVHVRERDILMITCSELGVAPDNISFQTPNRCVILQHLAGSVPSKHECQAIEGLSFDDVANLFSKYDFRHIIVCGHLHCGVIRNWLAPPPAANSDIGGFRARFESGTRDFVDEHYKAVSSEQRFTLMVCEHVLCQIENLLTHFSVADRVQRRATDLHGWVLDDATARVHRYGVAESAFLPI